MLTLAALLVLAGGPVPPTIGEVFYGHAMGHSDPIADITPLPARLPDCKTDEEIRKALAEKDQGRPQSCFVPRSARLPKQESR
jgi:hypothetical protein